MAVTAQNSKSAVTHYEVMAEYKNYTHVRLKLETGRTHQIRVHMAYLGHPVAGDTVYGSEKTDQGTARAMSAREGDRLLSSQRRAGIWNLKARYPHTLLIL